MNKTGKTGWRTTTPQNEKLMLNCTIKRENPEKSGFLMHKMHNKNSKKYANNPKCTIKIQKNKKNSKKVLTNENESAKIKYRECCSNISKRKNGSG